MPIDTPIKAAYAVGKALTKKKKPAKKKAKAKKKVPTVRSKTSGAQLLGSGSAKKATRAKQSRAQRNQAALKKAKAARQGR